MIRVENHLGTIEISKNYLTTLIRYTVSNCYGVAGMEAYGAKQGITKLFSDDSSSKQGIIIRQHNGKLIIDLHIAVSYGVNISAIVDSIINKVTFAVEQTGVEVYKINVYVDSMKA